MPEKHGRTEPLSIAIRAIPLLVVMAFAGFYLVFVWTARPPAQAKSSEPPAPTKSTGGPAQQGTIGRDCQQCHSAIVESFPAEIHGKSAKFLNDERAAKCQSCHANSEKHVETSTRAKAGEPAGSPATMTSVQANESCLQCHSRDRHVFNWKGGEHDRKDMSCMSCHSVHHSKSPDKMLANFTVEETCLRCHTDMRKAIFQRSTHLFRTELRNMKVGCASCHNPHGGEGDKMLVEFNVNNVCYSCHAEKRGPFLWEHPPSRENCMNCHKPHGSNNPKLLTARAHLLCQQCHIHMLPRHSTAAGRPLDIWSINRGCVNCHANVHGSNHPGGRTFGR
jgi:DmsE family decaheme c-type cytochrome